MYAYEHVYLYVCVYMCVVSLYLAATEPTCHSTMLLWQPTIGEYEKDREVSRVMDASCLPSDLNMMKGECQRAEGGGGERLSVASLAHLEWNAAFQPKQLDTLSSWKSTVN